MAFGFAAKGDAFAVAQIELTGHHLLTKERNNTVQRADPAE